MRLSLIAFLVSLLTTCSASPSYAEVGKYRFGGNPTFVEELNKIKVMPSSIEVDLVAVSVNNGHQERKKLPVAVKHHTLVDVFFCLSFISLPFMGELRLAIAFIALWWGGDENKPFIGRIPSAVLQRFLTLPTALYIGQIIKTTPVRKVL